MGKHVKKMLEIIATLLLGIIGIKYPIVVDTIKEIKEEIKDIQNENLQN